MKIEPRQVRFRHLFPWPTRRRLLFDRQGTSLQVEETGLIVQGLQRKLFMPFFDLFFQSVLSEPTTVTIPYGRILSLDYCKFLKTRLLLTLLFWTLLLPLPAYKLVTLSLWEGFSLNEAAYFLVLLVLLALILTLYVDCWLLVSRYRLLFQQADGKPALLSFRFRSPKVGERFSEQVEYHRRQAQGRPGAKPTSKQPPLKSPRLPGQGT